MDDIQAAFESLGDKLVGWGQQLITMLPNIAIAALVLVAFWFGAKLARKLTRKAAHRITDQTAVVNLLGTLTRVTVTIIGVFIALSFVQLDGTVTSLLAGVGILGLALGFAFQDIAANFVSGVLLAMNRPFDPGDLIETEHFFGRVERLTLRNTIGRNLDGQIVFIPNKEVFENVITNYKRAGTRRVTLEVGVAYGDDLERAERVTLDAITALDVHHADRPIELYYTSFGDSSINFQLRFWVDAVQKDWLRARSDAIKAIKRAFDEHGITIPFPIRTLDFGVVGGEPLRDALPTWMAPANGDRASGPRALQATDDGASAN